MTNGSSPGSPTQIDFTTKFVLFSSSSSQEGQLHAVYTISFAMGCKECFLLCVAGGASRYVLLVGIYPPLAPPGDVAVIVSVQELGAEFAAPLRSRVNILQSPFEET